VGCGLALILIVAVLIVSRVIPHAFGHATGSGSGTGAGTGTGSGTGAGSGTGTGGAAGAIGTYGIATTTAHCPAASVSKAARCPATPECWDGVFEQEGIVTLSPLPCGGPHTWQTFAIGIMPSDASTYNVNVVQANATVSAVCSQAVLLRSRNVRGRLAAPGQWIIQVAPPDEEAYNTGVRTYRCLARSAGLNGVRTSQFGA
jgi:hypothetical protein